MTRAAIWIGAAVVGALVIAGAWRVSSRPSAEERARNAALATERAQEAVRRALFDALQPVPLANCTFARFGEANDGGYLLCGNLLGAVQSGYSYGINGFDGWGCAVSAALRVPVHEYDCFNTSVPACGGDTRFHAECVSALAETLDGRPFDSIEHQIAKNADTGKRLVMKVDVEGAEWDSFLATSDATFANIDQLVVEFHRTEDARFLRTIEVLKRTFHVVHLHFNNHSCEAGLDPFPAWAYEVLFVNKRIGVVDPAAPRTAALDALDSPNATSVPDCQLVSP